MSGCGKNYFYAGRNLPPSGLLYRVLIAEQNPSALSKGALPFVDAFYDIRHAYNSSTSTFSISGYSGALPSQIQNMPVEQVGAVYGSGDGSLALVSYATEKELSTVAIPAGVSSSVFITQNEKYAFAANQQSHVVSVVPIGTTGYQLNLPNVYRVSVNPGGTIALAFVQNSSQPAGQAVGATPADFSVYSVVQLTTAQSQAAANNPNYQGAQDCEPQNLPAYCLFPVSTGANASFDHPTKAVFSADGSTAYILNCGPECGNTTPGAQASVSVVPIQLASLNPGVQGPAGIALTATQNIPIPGGATNAIFNGNTMYIAGQNQAADGLFQGNLTVLNTETNAISGTYQISDGNHTKMLFGDDDTLWVGSTQCQNGERYKQAQANPTANIAFGCMTMFNTSTNAVLVESYKGDGTGIASVTGLSKVYTSEGGQVYIYNTTDGSERDNTNVAVTGTAADVAYMDGATDGNNTAY